MLEIKIPLKFDIAHERSWLEDYFPFGKGSFQELCSTSRGYDNHTSWIRVKQRIKDFRSTQRMVYLYLHVPYKFTFMLMYINLPYIESLGLENLSHPIFKSTYIYIWFSHKKKSVFKLCFRCFCLLETFPNLELNNNGGEKVGVFLVGPDRWSSTAPCVTSLRE